MLASSSPRLIAGNHVLHRLVVPRHPSYALKYLTILCSLRQAQGKPRPVEDLLYNHFDTLTSHKEYADLHIRCAISLNLLQNCVGLIHPHKCRYINPLPIFVVKLGGAISMTLPEVALCEDAGGEPTATAHGLAYLLNPISKQL
jgi:hypothetical protein